MKSIDLQRTLVLNIDIQNGFGKNAQSDKLRGLRSSEDSEVAKSAQLSEAVYDAGGKVVVTKDWHNALGTKLSDGKIDNRAADEFALYDEHCVAGGKDTELNAPLEAAVQRMEAKGGTRSIMPVDRYDNTGRAGNPRLIEAHKNHYDITQTVGLNGKATPKQNFIALLAKARDEGIETVLITGKIAEVCVTAATDSIRELFPELDVRVVTDAVSALPEGVAETIGLSCKEQLVEAWAAKGVGVTTFDQVLPSTGFTLDGIMGK